MRIDDFTYMDRQGSSIKAITRLLVNGKLIGTPGRQRILKLSGFQNYTTNKGISGGGTITIQGNGVFFKHPSHAYAKTTQTMLMIDTATLYYYHASNGWTAVSWDGAGSADFLNADGNNGDVRFWFERGKLHIAAGPNGTPAVYMYIDREKDSDKNGFYNNNVELDGFWLGPEVIPTFDASSYLTITEFDALNNTVAYANCLQRKIRHYVMGVFVCGGDVAIPSTTGMTSFKGDAGAESYFVEIKITLPSSGFDKRITGIDLYAAIDNEAVEKGRIDLANDTDFPYIDWKHLRTIDINNPNLIWSGTAYADGGDTIMVIYKWLNGEGGELDGSLDHFPDDSLNNFKCRYRLSPAVGWTIRNVTDTLFHKNIVAGIDVLKITLDGANIDQNYYEIQVYSEWTADNGNYEIYTLWRFEGDESTVSELGSPIATTQPYALLNEYYPTSKFYAMQDRRVFTLAPSLDGAQYKNMLLWSEIDRPFTWPNDNHVLLNTLMDEEPTGLFSVWNGLLALFEKSSHYIRMTGEPIQYDAEEGKFNRGCISWKSGVEVDGAVYYVSRYGISRFSNGQEVDISEEYIRDALVSIIDSEATNNSGSYADIEGKYDSKRDVIIWTFPNSAASISSVTVDCVGYDVKRKGFFFLDSTKDYICLINDYDGKVYGMDTDAIYELFGSGPSENTKLIWESGEIMGRDFFDVHLKGIRLRYEGTPSVTVYQRQKASTRTITDGSKAFPEQTTPGNHSRTMEVHGENIRFRIEMADSNSVDIIEMLDVIAEEIQG